MYISQYFYKSENMISKALFFYIYFNLYIYIFFTLIKVKKK